MHFQVTGGLQNPHDVVVSPDASTVYVVELSPFVVWKLTNGGHPPSSSSSSSDITTTTPRPNQSIVEFLIGMLGRK